MRSKILTTLLVLLVYATAVLAGTTGKISGTVTDAKTGDPLIGVNVLVEGTTLGAATDIDGHYVILNVPPGKYTLKASMIGFASQRVIDVRVNIDQTTEINFELTEESFETEEVVVVAKEPVVKKGVSSSGANLNVKEIENLPVVNVSSVVGLQAGIEGLSIRGGSTNQTTFMVNGITMKDGRDNSPYSNISFTSIEQVQIKTGGFNAEYGEVRSGMVNVVTKEGSKNEYTFSMLTQYSPKAPKHFGKSPHAWDSYYMRPYLDDEVAWTGTNNGAWDEYMKRQYPEFEGWNAIAERTLQNDDPSDDLTPEAARRLFLFQHRKNLDIDAGDYDLDMSFGGPVPVIGKALGDLRFMASYKKSNEMYVIPLSEDRYENYNASLKLTSDIAIGMKLMIEGHYGTEWGTNTSTSGWPGIFDATWEVAGNLAQASYIDSRMFTNSYWAPTEVTRNSLAAKFTHVLDDKTYYEITANSFASEYDTGPGSLRDTSRIYKFGNSYYVDEGPFGFWPYSSSSIDGMRTGGAMSTSRDSSYIRTSTLKFDITSQVNKYNNIKAGFEFKYTHNETNYGRYDEFLQGSNVNWKWKKFPLQAAMYVQDKLEFEGMIANIGLRMDYSDPNSDWYVYDRYDEAFKGENESNRDALLETKELDAQMYLSPRIGVAFPITENSKLFFNYGHFVDLPTPDDLFRITTDFQGHITYISNPETDFQRTIAYELGYEQNLADQYLFRVTGYYKDVSNETANVNYINEGANIDYSKVEPVLYRDIRGFEATLSKNRGSWIRGFLNYTYMVTKYGRFEWGRQYYNPTNQEQYQNTTAWHIQVDPTPRPYARANIDIFTPMEYGPKLGGIFPFGDIRLNILANWKAGRYDTWTGGSNIAGIQNNVQWRDYFNVNLKISKHLQFGSLGLDMFVQINNLFDVKRMGEAGFSSNEDRIQYFRSLHLPEEAIEGNFGYINIPGEDQPGDYREKGVDFTPIKPVGNVNDVADPTEGLVYWDQTTRSYLEFTDIGWEQVDENRMQQILDDKAYIDMPNQTYFTFLSPRDIYFGLKMNFAF